MYVHGTAVLIRKPDEALTELVDDIRERTGQYFRRVNRFILLSLAGAHHCMADRVPDPGTMVCLTTENGSVEDTGIALEQLFHERSYPKPYNFINTMSNTASFYIAQSMKLRSPNLTVSSMRFAFERGLELVRTDFNRGAAEHALVGGVDEANLQGPLGEWLVDGSAWLYLSRHKTGAAGEIAQIRSFSNIQSALDWVERAEFADTPVVAFGGGITKSEQGQWQAVRPGARTLDERRTSGGNRSAACSICHFFQSRAGETLLHVNKDRLGNYTLLTALVY